MPVTRALLLGAAAWFCFVPAPVSAQPWQGRVLLDANVATSTSGSTFSDDFTYKHPYSANIPGEEASVETSFGIPSAVLFEGGVLVRIFQNVAAGVGFYQASSTGDLDVSARIPHPFLIAHHRAVEGSTPVRHEQNGLHLNAAYVLPVTTHLYVAASGGPTYFSVNQGVVKTVAVAETYPYDVASFANADFERLSASGWGFNAGVDVGWMFSSHFGAGGLLRYSKATLSPEPTGRDPREIDVGGLHGGIGARIAF
jgi:hypothetical protein